MIDKFNRGAGFEAKDNSKIDGFKSRNLGEMTRYAIDQIKCRYELAKRNEPQLLGIPTGFIDIDKVTFGLRPGIAVVGARPEISMTDFALNIALSASQGYKVAYFCPGFDAKLLSERIVAMTTWIRFSDIVTGEFIAERDFSRMNEAAKRLKDSNLTFVDHSLDAQSFYNECTQILEEKGLDLIVLDKLQSLYPFKDSSGESFYWRAREVASFIHDLKSEHGLTLLVLSEIKKRKNKEARLTTEDLRDFGTLEYDAYPIFLLERASEEPYRPFENDWTPVIVHIENNPIGIRSIDVPLNYIMSYGRYETPAKIED